MYVCMYVCMYIYTCSVILARISLAESKLTLPSILFRSSRKLSCFGFRV